MEALDFLGLLGEFAVDGLVIALPVFLIVQAFKICGLVTSETKFTPEQLALTSALFFGLFWLAIEFGGVSDWTYEVVLTLIFRWFVGSTASGLFYQVVLKPILEKAGVPEKYITGIR